MAFAHSVNIAPHSAMPHAVRRSDVFNVSVTAPARLAAGVLGLTVLVRHDSRQFRFAVTSGTSGNASSDDLAKALASTIERACDRAGEAAVVEEVVVLLRSSSLPISCDGVTSKNLLPLLKRIAGSVVASGKSSLPS